MSNILVYRIGSLGDALVSLPAVHKIRFQHPDSKITLLTNQPTNGLVSSWDILKHSGVFDSVLYYRPDNIFDIFGLLIKLRLKSPSILYYLAPVRSASQISRDRKYFGSLGGIQKLIGFDQAEKASVCGNHEMPEKEATRLLRISNPTALLNHEVVTQLLNIPEANQLDALTILAECKISTIDKLIAIVPGSKMSSKRWPVENYVSTCQRLLEDYPDLKFITLGSSDEFDLCSQFTTNLGSSAVNLAGKTSIMTSASLLQSAQLYLGNDTGTMHLAAVLGTPCVALFSARDIPGKWYPFGKEHTIFQKETTCAGCMLTDCTEHDIECLRAISVDEVYDRVKNVLNYLA